MRTCAHNYYSGLDQLEDGTSELTVALLCTILADVYTMTTGWGFRRVCDEGLLSYIRRDEFGYGTIALPTVA